MKILIEHIENDDFFQGFLSENRNNTSIASLSITEQIKKLAEGLDVISKELQHQVREQHGALLSQASHAGKLTAALDAVSGHMERLKNGAERLTNQVNGPYSMLENQTHVLERLHDASHLLRQAGRFLQLHRQLQSCKDPVSQAKLFFELEPLIDDDLVGQIEFIRDERSIVIAARQRLNNVAHNDLLNGLKTENHSMVLNSLQIFSNLQRLSKCLDNLLDTFIADIKQSMKECFSGTDIAGINTKKSRTATKVSNQTTGQNFRSKLWMALEWLFDEEIYGFCQQIVFLQKSVESIQSNAFVSTSSNDIEKRFWTNLENTLQKAFSECAPHVTQALQQDLPKLLANARGLQAKFGAKFIFSDAVFQSLEAGYLEKCGINLKAALSGVDYPSQDTVDNMIRVASAELSVAMVDNRLCLLVANVFNTCNAEFLTKIESHVKLGTDSQQVVDIPNASQIQNTSLANIAFYHSEMIKRLIQNLGPNFGNSEAADIIIQGLNKGKTLILAVIQQLIESINLAINIIILSVHREPGLHNDKPLNAGPSFYMKELQEFIQRTWNLHIASFADEQSINECGVELANRCIEMFIRNVAIIRPVSMEGRKRLKSDCLHLETAIKPVINDLSTLGKPYRQLKALSTVLTMTPEELSNQSTDSNGLLPTYIVSFLLFSHAGSDLTSPHTAAEWSNEKLLQWLDGHTSDRERLELVTGALQKYRTIVRQKNISHYDPVYPFITSYLEKAYKNVS